LGQSEIDPPSYPIAPAGSKKRAACLIAPFIWRLSVAAAVLTVLGKKAASGALPHTNCGKTSTGAVLEVTGLQSKDFALHRFLCESIVFHHQPPDILSKWGYADSGRAML
jgi:hypothetical protein